MAERAPPRGFSAEEFEARCGRAQARMATQGLDALLLTTEPEVRYFSGFLTQFWQSPTRPWFLIVPAEGKPVAVVPNIGAACMRRTGRRRCSPVPQHRGYCLPSARRVHRAAELHQVVRLQPVR